MATTVERRQIPDIDWLIGILEHEWEEADAILARADELSNFEVSEFDAEWPLLASWWERIVARDRQEPLTPHRRERVACVEQTIRRLMPTIVELVGPEMARMDGLDI
jgi:hypothetical protein